MKNKLILMEIFFTLISCLIIFNGCAEKKATVKSEQPQVQETAPAPTPPPAPETSKQPTTAAETAKIKEAAGEQSSLMGATEKSPIRDINFDFDSSSIRPDAREILKVNADYLHNHRASSIVVEGHCDERGTAEYNMALGQRRAQETKNYLVNLGINESTVKTISYGKERPLDPASSEEAWAKNRRAHFVVTP